MAKFRRIKRRLSLGRWRLTWVGMLRLSELRRAEARAQHDNKIKIKATYTNTRIAILSTCSSSLAKKNQVEGPLLANALMLNPRRIFKKSKQFVTCDYLLVTSLLPEFFPGKILSLAAISRP
jgi:hypothetical protein